MHSPAPTARLSSQQPAIPLTEAQLGLWYAQRLDPGNPIFNTAQAVEIDGDLDVPAFGAAVAAALAEAGALTVRMAEGEDGPVQWHGDDPLPTLELIDLRGEADPALAAEGFMARDGGTPLDPARDPLVREVLFDLGDGRHLWYQRIHHLVIDGYGVGLLTRRIADLYGARRTGRTPGAPLAPFSALIEEDSSYRHSARRDTDRAFWGAAFAGAPAVEGLAPGVAITGREFHRRGMALTGIGAEALDRLAVAARVPWPDVLVGLVAAYVRRHLSGGGSDEVVVGVPFMNRFGSAAARVPAMVMNVLPVRLTVDEDVPLVRCLGAVSQILQRARRHGRYRSEQLRRDLGLLGGTRRLHGPLINVLPFDEAPDLPGARTRLRVLGTGPVDDLTFTLRADARGNGLHLEIDANPALYGEAVVAEHTRRLARFLETALGAERLAAVPTLTPAEHFHWIAGVNDTAHPVEERTLTAWIEAAMRRTPDAPALAFDGTTLTYADLDRATARLARRLAAAGVGRGGIVGVALPRSLELVVALVAILRAGAAYLPIDPEHPAERIALTLDSARPTVILTVSGVAGRLPADGPLMTLDGFAGEEGDGEEGDGEAGFAAAEPTRDEDPAYVIYTSGSTGVPKGVVIDHRAIVNRLDWMRAHYGFGPDDRILQKTPATFDVSVWEFFLPLVVGATLVVAPPGAHKDPAWLASLLRAKRITTAHFVPSMLAQFLDEPAAAGIVLRRVFCSGEELPAALRDRFHQVVTAELHNLYGPTEAAVDVTWWPAGPDDRSSPVPIGFPVWNTAMYVLDGRLRPVPPGVVGDLYIAGRQLARGYLRQPELTAERFIRDPFGEPGARMYRTGDVARWRRDGALEFLGRSDHQVKIRGLRVELGDIEAAVRSAPTVGQAAVVAREDRPGDKRLVAYVTPGPSGAAVDLAGLAAHLAARLPDCMVPAVVPLPALPVTHNGKLDRAALPAPERRSATERRPPAPGSEERLARLFAEVLGLDTDVAADDDFFELGGHSLLAAQAMRRVRDDWRMEVGLGTLFVHSTVSRLAAHLDSLALATGEADLMARGREGLGVVVPLAAAAGDGLPPVFCVHPAGGVSWCYAGLARALALGTGRGVYGIQARGLDPAAAVPGDLAAMAADYAAEVRAIRPQGPYHLAGWSVGGIIAQAMAVHLAEEGERIGVLAMLDSYPSDCWRNEPDPDEGAALKALMQIAGIDAALWEGVSLNRSAAIGLLRTAGHPLADLPDETLGGMIRVVENNNRLVRRHHHRRSGAPLLHFRAALDHAGTSLSPGQWEPYVAGVEVHEVPALHGQLIGAAATRCIAPVLRARLAAFDRE